MNEEILVSVEEEQAIKSKSPDRLPLNPTRQGYSGQEVRRALAGYVIDNKDSILSLLKEKMALTKDKFDELYATIALLQLIDQINPTFESVTFEQNVYTQGDITTVGKMFYDNEKHTLTFLTDLGEYIEIGLNLGDVGKNDNGDTYEGAPVAWAGVQGGHKLFKQGIASDPNLSSMVGVLTTSINGILPKNAFGKVSVFGEITIPDFRVLMESGTDAGLTFGSKLYLSATVAGTYTTEMPDRPNTAIWVGTVTDINTSSHKGKIFIFPQKVRDENSTRIHYENLENAQINDLFVDYD
jgi:hypothetical protein